LSGFQGRTLSPVPLGFDGCLALHDRKSEPAADAQDAGPEYQDAGARNDDDQGSRNGRAA
jgi:hypothetical protein